MLSCLLLLLHLMLLMLLLLRHWWQARPMSLHITTAADVLNLHPAHSSR
jgi:hypothetical protein